MLRSNLLCLHAVFCAHGFTAQPTPAHPLSYLHAATGRQIQLQRVEGQWRVVAGKQSILVPAPFVAASPYLSHQWASFGEALTHLGFEDRRLIRFWEQRLAGAGFRALGAGQFCSPCGSKRATLNEVAGQVWLTVDADEGDVPVRILMAGEARTGF